RGGGDEGPLGPARLVLVHVPDVGLADEDVRPVVPVDLHHVSVVVLDDAADLFAVRHLHHHRGPRVLVLREVVRLRARGFRRRHPAARLRRSRPTSPSLPIRTSVVTPVAVTLIHAVSPSLYPSTWRAVT